MVRRLLSKLPRGALTPVHAVYGWCFMLLGTYHILGSFTSIEPLTENQREFFTDMPSWLFGAMEIVIGFILAKPGHKYRLAKSLAACFLCVMFIGVSVWPLFTDSGTSINMVGVIFWTGTAMLVVNDTWSPTYQVKNLDLHH